MIIGISALLFSNCMLRKASLEKQTMFEFLKKFLILYFCLNVTYGIECPTESDKKCKQFWFKIFTDMGSNLEEGIKCLGAPVLPLKLSLYNPRLKIITVDEFQKVQWLFYTYLWSAHYMFWPIFFHKNYITFVFTFSSAENREIFIDSELDIRELNWWKHMVSRLLSKYLSVHQ